MYSHTGNISLSHILECRDMLSSDMLKVKGLYCRMVALQQYTTLEIS